MICAWCPDFNPADPANRGQTHGMCEACAAKWTLSTFEIRASQNKTLKVLAGPTLTDRCPILRKIVAFGRGLAVAGAKRLRNITVESGTDRAISYSMKNNSRRVEVSTRQYESDHGARPRGRGNWGFCQANIYGRADYLEHVFWFNGLYGDAKRAAVAHFASLPEGDTIVVCS